MQWFWVCQKRDLENNFSLFFPGDSDVGPGLRTTVPNSKRWFWVTTIAVTQTHIHSHTDTVSFWFDYAYIPLSGLIFLSASILILILDPVGLGHFSASPGLLRLGKSAYLVAFLTPLFFPQGLRSSSFCLLGSLKQHRSQILLLHPKERKSQLMSLSKLQGKAQDHKQPWNEQKTCSHMLLHMRLKGPHPPL